MDETQTQLLREINENLKAIRPNITSREIFIAVLAANFLAGLGAGVVVGLVLNRLL